MLLRILFLFFAFVCAFCAVLIFPPHTAEVSPSPNSFPGGERLDFEVFGCVGCTCRDSSLFPFELKLLARDL